MVASATASPLGGRTSPAPSKDKESVQSATRSSAETSSCRRSAVRLARICSTRAACSSGSRRVMRVLVRYVGRRSTSIKSGYALIAYSSSLYKFIELEFCSHHENTSLQCDVARVKTWGQISRVFVSCVSLACHSVKQRVLG
jgi:hypothetical protein